MSRYISYSDRLLATQMSIRTLVDFDSSPLDLPLYGDRYLTSEAALMAVLQQRTVSLLSVHHFLSALNEWLTRLHYKFIYIRSGRKTKEGQQYKNMIPPPPPPHEFDDTCL